MTIFNFEFKMLRKSILFWILGIAAFLAMYMSFFPSFGKDVALMEKILANYPKEMIRAMGMNTDLPLSSLMGYFAFTFPFIQIMFAIQASYYGFSILSVEERDLTADFLMTKPVSRHSIILSKFLATFSALSLTSVSLWAVSFILLEILSEGIAYERSFVWLLLITNSLFQLVFLSVGMVISVSVKKIRSVLSYAIALGFGTYMISAVARLLESRLISYFSPFAHFDPNYILQYGSLDMPITLVSLLVILFSLNLCYFLYLKRNIHSL